MHNVEYKCELRDRALAITILRTIGAQHIARIDQRDTYFRVPDCRLKRREASVNGRPEPIEYIRYERADVAHARISRYSIIPEREALTRFGTAELPVLSVVEKTRELWMLDSMRVHLDSVQNLGEFLELEALVTPRQNVARSYARLAEIKGLLAHALGEPISSSYSDLMPGPAGEAAEDWAAP